MALRDILNSGKYGDDIVLTLPDGSTATVGEMRALSQEERQQLQQRQQLVEQAELAIAQRVQELQKAGAFTPTQNQPAYSDVQIRNAAAQEYGLDPNDPLLGPVVREFRAQQEAQKAELEAMRNDFGKAVKSITDVVQTAVGANLEERYQTDFERATKVLPEGVKVEYQKAFEYANANGLKDKWGRLDINSAVDRLTWESRKQAELERIREQAIQEAESKARLAGATRPRVSSPENHRARTDFSPVEQITDPKTGRTRAVVKSFDQALAEATNDEALLQSALSTASFGLVN
jgi:hypothetical protein